MSDQDLMTPAEAAQFLRLSPATLELWRATRQGPPWYRVGERRVGYRRSELDEWLSARAVRPTVMAEG